MTLYLLIAAVMAVTFIPLALITCEGRGDCAARLGITVAVSYTHLTLPTNREV